MKEIGESSAISFLSSKKREISTAVSANVGAAVVRVSKGGKI